MNKKAALFATLTIVIMFAFVIGHSMRKDQILKENGLVEAGKESNKIIGLSLKEVEYQFFIRKSIEAAAYKSLIDLGAKGGFFANQKECGNVDGYTLFNKDCNLPIQIQQEFFQYFTNNFDKIITEKGLKNFNKEIIFNEKGEWVLRVNGKVDFSSEGVRYNPEFDESFVINFDLNDFYETLNMASDCVEKERRKGQGQNLLFEDCRNDPGFEWIIKEKEKNVFFDITTKNKFLSFGPVLIKFAIPL